MLYLCSSFLYVCFLLAWMSISCAGPLTDTKKCSFWSKQFTSYPQNPIGVYFVIKGEWRNENEGCICVQITCFLSIPSLTASKLILCLDILLFSIPLSAAFPPPILVFCSSIGNLSIFTLYQAHQVLKG